MQTVEQNRVIQGLLEKTKKTNFEFQSIAIPGYELVLRIKEKKSQLDAIIAIHNTSLGPALGGTRILPYTSFDHALEDVLRLSKGMTYKSAIACTGLGGGKSVILFDESKQNKEEVLLAFGQAINDLQGMYICAEDMGCGIEDVKVIAEKTPYVVGLCHDKSSGNPSPFTAWGVFRGIQAAVKYQFGTSSLEGKKIAVQGLGSVGEKLCDYLFWHGADLIITDVDSKKVDSIAKKYRAMAVNKERIYQVECDVFSPCAIGGIINEMTIPSLRCKVVAGGANNQLFCNNNADQLKKRGILYVPDFVINAGGLINVTEELYKEGYDSKKARKKTNDIYNTLIAIFDIAKVNNQSTHSAAQELASYRIKYGIGKRKAPLYFHHAAKG